MKKLVWILLFGLSAFAWGSEQDDAFVKAYQAGDYKTVISIIQPLAEQGNAEAQSNLGAMYHNGYGVPQDYKQAVSWYAKAAEQGNADAQTNLGVMYANGQGVPQDKATAYMLFNLAASNGDKDAIKNRDVMLQNMTPTQIEQGQQMARDWLVKHPKSK